MRSTISYDVPTFDPAVCLDDVFEREHLFARWSILERVAPLLQRQVDGAKSRRQCSRDRISLQA
jgi:hypothetical protein